MEETVQQRFDWVLNASMDDIRKSSTPTEIKAPGPGLGDKCVQELSRFLDLYVCFRLLKPYVEHSILVVGVHHIDRVDELMSELGLERSSSER